MRRVSEFLGKWAPTRKWWAATVVGGVGMVTMVWTGDPTLTDPEKIALVTFVGQRLVSYFLPNEDTPGGIPQARHG